MQLAIKQRSEPQPYEPIWDEMRAAVKERSKEQTDELWLMEHQPVFTQGQAGKAEHVLNAGDIPIIQTDRGGQVTYHGPGQLMAYFLADIRRLDINVRMLVMKLENVVIQLMKQFDVEARGKRDAPGVYVGDKKLCSIGLRVSRGYSYHGFALNVDLDLEPFARINPCGFKGLQMTRITDYAPNETVSSIADKIAVLFKTEFGYNHLVK